MGGPYQDEEPLDQAAAHQQKLGEAQCWERAAQVREHLHWQYAAMMQEQPSLGKAWPENAVQAEATRRRRKHYQRASRPYSWNHYHYPPGLKMNFAA